MVGAPGGGGLGGDGQAGQTAEATLEDVAHDPAGDHDVRIAEPIADLAAIAIGVHQARPPQDREVLRHVRLAETQLLGEPADLAWPIGQPMEDLQAARVGEGPQDLGSA